MASKEKNLVKNTLLFSVGNVGAKLMMLVIVPLYTYYVSVNQMGDYDLVHTYINLFSPLACAAIFEGIYRWLLDARSSDGDTIKTGYTTALLCVTVFDVLAFVVLKAIDYTYLWEFILVVDSQCMYTIAQFTTRGLRNNKTYAVQGVVYSFVLVLSNLVMVVFLHWQAKGLLYSVFAANFITSLIVLASQGIGRRYIKGGQIHKSLAKDLLKYSLPIVPNNIAWWLVSGSNRTVINIILGSVSNGIYAISLKFPTVMNMLSTFFYQAWQEQAISEYSSDGRDRYYTKIFNIYVRLLFTGAMALMPISKYIILTFMNPDYREAYLYIGILYLSGIFNAFGAFYGTGYLSTKKTMGAFTTTILGAVTNIAISFILMRFIGLYAAAIGNMVGNFVIWVSRIVQTKRYFRIDIDIKSLIFFLGFTLVFVIVVNFANLYVMIIAELIACTLFLTFNRDMLQRIINMVFHKKRG